MVIYGNCIGHNPLFYALFKTFEEPQKYGALTACSNDDEGNYDPDYIKKNLIGVGRYTYV